MYFVVANAFRQFCPHFPFHQYLFCRFRPRPLKSVIDPSNRHEGESFGNTENDTIAFTPCGLKLVILLAFELNRWTQRNYLRSTENIEVLWYLTLRPLHLYHVPVCVSHSVPGGGKNIRTNRIHSFVLRTEFVGNDITECNG